MSRVRICRIWSRPNWDEVLALVDAAAGEAGQLGMVPFSEWIEQLRTRLPATAAGSLLSPRELEVARLVGQGLTNKQIGQNLYVSERTA
jgi:DNA-binding NarL/FixJ family response regulator